MHNMPDSSDSSLIGHSLQTLRACALHEVIPCRAMSRRAVGARHTIINYTNTWSHQEWHMCIGSISLEWTVVLDIVDAAYTGMYMYIHMFYCYHACQCQFCSEMCFVDHCLAAKCARVHLRSHLNNSTSAGVCYLVVPLPTT